MIRSGHGTGAGTPHVEVQPLSEQAVGVPAAAGPAKPLEPEGGRSSNGRIADRELATELARRGGLARAAKAAQLRALIGLGLLGALPEVLRPYLDAANEFADAEVERLARECGGGVCPQNAAALVQQAALAMAGSRAAYAQGDLATGAKLGVEVRQNLLGARELTVLEAKSRPTARRSLDDLLGPKREKK
ncbi:MAG: hypothetical protein WDO69_25090 [Pseudomonadota bacterium]